MTLIVKLTINIKHHAGLLVNRIINYFSYNVTDLGYNVIDLRYFAIRHKMNKDIKNAAMTEIGRPQA